MIERGESWFPSPAQRDFDEALKEGRQSRHYARTAVEETRPHMHYLELALVWPPDPKRPRGTREAEPTP